MGAVRRDFSLIRDESSLLKLEFHFDMIYLNAGLYIYIMGDLHDYVFVHHSMLAMPTYYIYIYIYRCPIENVL